MASTPGHGRIVHHCCGRRHQLHGRGLANGTDYTFKIAATSDHGTGSASEPSAIARPIGGPPDAPTIGETTVSGPNQLTVNWTNGADGGMPLSGYTVQASDNGGPMTTVSGSCAAFDGIGNFLCRLGVDHRPHVHLSGGSY